uniref:Late embryogenesis abundant protein LEA-2 subgroup domain-containing protein n=1 Tax=Leersia perrieri TaxID=77586 RepID=A0A0D9W6Z3_9ORYZ
MASPCDNGCRGPARDLGRSAALTTVSLIFLLLALFVIASSTYGDNIREEHAATAPRAVYSAAVTKVDGLHGYLFRGRSYDSYEPVFYLTIHMKVPGGGENDVCIGGRSAAAVVSYGDVFLGKGSVPRLCVEPHQEGAVAVMAWGIDVRIPQVMKSRLNGDLKRGETELDVAVPMRSGEVLVCKAKIGGGPFPCTLEEASIN